MSTGPMPTPDGPPIEIGESRSADVGGLPVRRALPRHGRRTVGAWCFADHMGPSSGDGPALNIGPHPHVGLQTVTWLFEGEVLHRDSLGSEQPIRPGQLNLMTAGHGVSHSEETTGGSGARAHGVQLWVAQPSTTRDGAATFEHHTQLPVAELRGCRITIMVGSLVGERSPARADTDHLGAELALQRGTTTIEIDPGHEHALVVTTGLVRIGTSTIAPGNLAYIALGRDELHLAVDGPSTALLLGGSPFPEPITMWWNYVARSTNEITDAHADWTARSGRYGTVASSLDPIDVGPPPWARSPNP
ncbi:MAG: pirin family protein [Acidimicrobiales bacterium]